MDACDDTVGGILVQDGVDNGERVIQYVSHQLDSTRSVVPPKKKKLMRASTNFTTICGAKFTIPTDYKPYYAHYSKIRWLIPKFKEIGTTFHIEMGGIM